MFNIIEGNIENYRQGFLFSYAQIVFNQFKRYAILLSDNEEPEDYRKFTIEYERKAEMLECKVLCVLTTALFIESYIYDYCARKKSETYFRKYMDKLDPTAKWILTTKIFAPPGIKEDSDIVGRLQYLYKYRNELVHHKTKKSEEFLKTPEFPENLEPLKCIKIIVDLLTQLTKIDKKEMFADFVLSHFDSWAKHCSRNQKLYPIPWEA